MTQRAGFPHSDIRGSKGARPSPRLIAACHVLHRFLVPRHPPDALRRLISATRRDNARTKRPGPYPACGIVKKDSRRFDLIRHHGTRYPKIPTTITPRPNLDRTYSPCQTAKQSRTPPLKGGYGTEHPGQNPGRSLSSREDFIQSKPAT